MRYYKPVANGVIASTNKWPYKWVTGVMTSWSGVMDPILIPTCNWIRGPPCRYYTYIYIYLNISYIVAIIILFSSFRFWFRTSFDTHNSGKSSGRIQLRDPTGPEINTFPIFFPMTRRRLFHLKFTFFWVCFGPKIQQSFGEQKIDLRISVLSRQCEPQHPTSLEEAHEFHN